MSDMSIKKSISRRSVIKGGFTLAACAALGVGYFAKSSKVAQAADSTNELQNQLGFGVDTQKCTNCMKCVDACKAANKTPDSIAPRRKVTAYTTAAGETVYITTSCMHCAVPACAAVCPAHAIHKRDGDGIVAIDSTRCIGCRYCYQACPFRVPHYAAVMDKCDCCLAIGIEPGQPTTCVKACPTGALNYGTIAEILEKSNGRAMAVKGPSGPSFFIS